MSYLSHPPNGGGQSFQVPASFLVTLALSMASISSGNIELGGKTYNPTQINSVEIGTVPRNPGVWLMFLFLGIPGLLLVAIHPVVWLLGTVGAVVFAAVLSSQMDWAVFFDMSSGKVAAFTSEDKRKVEAVKRDITSVLR